MLEFAIKPSLTVVSEVAFVVSWHSLRRLLDNGILANFGSMFDIIVVALSVFAFVRGVRRGLIGELAGLVALALGVYGAARFSPVTEGLLAPYLGGCPTRLVAFGVTLLVIVVAVYFVSSLATRLAAMVALSLPNRLFGGVFGVAKALLAISCVIGLADRLWPGPDGIFTEEEKKSMVTYKFVEAFSGYAFPYIDKGLDAVREAASEKKQ